MTYVGLSVIQQLEVSEDLFDYSKGFVLKVYESSLWLTNVSGFAAAV